MPLCCPKPPECTTTDEYEWAVQLIANPSHVHPHRPHPKAHHSALSHSVTHDNQERDYGDQINYGLIQNAMVLTTVNPGLPKHWRRLITLILLVYAAEASMPTFPTFVSGESKWIVLHWFIDIAFHLWWPRQYFRGNATLCCYFSIVSSLHLFSCRYFCFKILCANAVWTVSNVFHEVAWTQKWGYQITHILPCLHCIVVFQNPLKHIKRLPLDMEIYLYILK